MRRKKFISHPFTKNKRKSTSFYAESQFFLYELENDSLGTLVTFILTILKEHFSQE